MKIWKRITSLFCAAALAAAMLTGCTGGTAASSAAPSEAPSSQETSEPASEPEEVSSAAETETTDDTTIRIGALKGPTGLGMLQLMQEANDGEKPYEFTLAGAADELTGKITTGELDAVALPTNTAATLYNKTEGALQIAMVNTLGVLYLVTSGDTEINSVADLAGKTVVSSGQGTVAEYAFNYILSANGLEAGKDVTVEYKSEHSEIAALMAAGEADIAVLPQPFVTQATSQNPDLKVALDLTEEWEKATDGASILTMGCLVVRRDFAEEHKEAFDAFLDDYKASMEYVNANPAEAAVISGEVDLIPAAVAEKAIPECNIVYVDGAEMKEKLPGFLQILYDANPQSVGGAMPGDDFYYEK